MKNKLNKSDKSETVTLQLGPETVKFFQAWQDDVMGRTSVELTMTAVVRAALLVGMKETAEGLGVPVPPSTLS